MMRRAAVIAVLVAAAFWSPGGAAPRGVRVASKKFTESVILGEILAGMVRAGGDDATHLAELGGTRLVYDALRRGEVDAYPEYTGTLREEIFSGRATTADELTALLSADGVALSAPLGFSNNYALAVRRDLAEKLKLRRISDLVAHPDLRCGFNNEFLDRADGWRNLRRRYGLPQKQVTGVDHDLGFRQIAAGMIDVMDVYTTEAGIEKFDLVLLEDDREYFPQYEAVLLVRRDLAERFPRAAKQLTRLAGRIDAEQMMSLNAAVDARQASEAEAARSFLAERLGVEPPDDAPPRDESVATAVWHRTVEHVDLVRRSLLPAILAAVPLGVVAAKRPRLGQLILGLAGAIQTIPALALLVLLMGPVAWLRLESLGPGSATAIVALFLYSLLPIVRNTAAGLAGIAPEHHESAIALGLPPWRRLVDIELPLASPAILAGVKTAAVLNVGFATLGALVGARGYGQPILTGIRLNDYALILQGALPAAALALALQFAFELAERRLVPAGLRLPPGGATS